jgi:hypothetical protein
MRTDEQRAKRRAAKARQKARDPAKWRRMRMEQQRRRMERLKAADGTALAAERERHREANKRWMEGNGQSYYAKNRDRILERKRQARRLRGIPTKQERSRAAEERRLAKEAERAARKAERAARKAETPEARRERWRLQTKAYRARHPDKKREQDQRYVAKHKEKVREWRIARKARAKERGYRWKPTAEYKERHRVYEIKRNLVMTAAVRYLRSLGLTEWWGPQETTALRREAAYRYAKQHGLIPQLSSKGGNDD